MLPPLSMRLAAAIVLATALPAWAAKEEPPPPLTEAHEHPSGDFSFRTPAGWRVEGLPNRPEVLETTNGVLLVRFVYRRGEVGYDSLHVDCMLERLAGAMETAPQVKYEYDFIGGILGDYRALDSAFVVTYDAPIQGERQWRQRNVTMVGNGRSLCAISYAPAPVWKKSKATRALLDGILASVTFR